MAHRTIALTTELRERLLTDRQRGAFSVSTERARETGFEERMFPSAVWPRKSGHPESSQGPSDICNLYSQMLYQLSYSRLGLLAPRRAFISVGGRAPLPMQARIWSAELVCVGRPWQDSSLQSSE